MRGWFYGALLSLTFVASPLLAAPPKNASLEERVRALEQKTDASRKYAEEGESGKVETFLSEKISLGGFFEHSMTGIFSQDHSSKFSADSYILGLNLSAKLHEKFHFVNQTLFFLAFPLNNQHDATQRAFGNTPAFGSLFAHAYGEYAASERFRLQMGVGWVPFGISLANRELPVLLRRLGPQLASGGLPMPSAAWTGLHVLGEIPITHGTWGYHLYSATPGTDANMIGGGSRLWWASPQGKLKLGASSQIVDRSTDTVFNLGGDVEWKFKRFGATAEYMRSLSSGEDLWTAYAQPYVQLAQGKWVLHADVDYANRPLHFSDGAAAVPFQKWELGGGVNWLPWSFLRARLLVLYNNYTGSSASTGGKTNDYYTVEYSTGIEF